MPDTRDSHVPADVIAHVRLCSGLTEISHAAAREIARTFASGTGIDRTFVESGEIAHRTDLWRGLFGYGRYDRLAADDQLGFGQYDRLNADDQLAADALGTYLCAREHTGPVADWSTLTLSDS